MVLLILAGVSISLIVDNNGIIKRSKDARREYGQAKENEQKDLSNLSDMIDDATGKVAKIDVNTKANKNGTINGKEGNSNNPTIPEGYTPIDTETSEWGDGSTTPSQDSVDHGLVIRDDNNNEWVWIPVPDVTVMCDTSNQTEYTLYGTTGETAVTTNKYSKSEIIIEKTRTTPGTTIGYREPDLAIGYDAEDTYYKIILGEKGTKEELAQLFVDEYKEMIESINKYGGFYIGRYELSEAGVQKDHATLTKTNWYNLYKKCKELKASNKVETGMIWGCQWDVTCNFIANKGDRKDITNSSTWGNYNNYNASNNYTEVTVGYEKNAGTLQNTGTSENWKANNIYDLAGNCWEWTQEEANTIYRALRGGNFANGGSGDFRPASGRGVNCSSNYSNNAVIRFSSYFNNKVTF